MYLLLNFSKQKEIQITTLQTSSRYNSLVLKN